MAALLKQIGKYPVISKLAVGGMGEVYKATHPTLGLTIIIKCLTIKNHPEVEERFRREARIMMDLRDERIVQVYDHFKQRSSYCIAMEYVEGIDLQHLIVERRYLSNDIALLIFTEVCKALKYAHERKVIHRDIKPANILISKAGEVKLTDFGVATTTEQDEDLTGEGMTLGTPAYMAPEQILDPGKADQRADIYSMGVLLYVMLTGQKPFEGPFTPQVLSSVNRGRYIPPRKINPRIPSPIQRLIKKTMHHKLKKRYQDIEKVLAKCSKLLKSSQDKKQINEVIRQYLEGEESDHDKSTKRGRFSPKHPIGVASALIVILLLALGGTIAYWYGWHYEFFLPSKYGAFRVEAQVRNGGRDLLKKNIHSTLFSQNEKSWEEVRGMNLMFKEDVSASETNFSVLFSQKRYLPKGNYLIRLDLGNEQYQTQFYLAPRSIQRDIQTWKDGYQIKIAMERNTPKLPLKFDCIVKDFVGGKEITKDIQIFIFYDNKWTPWDVFAKDQSMLKSFTSGKDYSFKFSGQDFFTKYANTSVDPEQTVLNLEVTLTPQPGSLFIKTEVPRASVLLNDLPYYLEGGEYPAYKKLGPLDETGLKISLPAGDYFLTIKEEKSWWQRISLIPPKLLPLRSDTLKITIRHGKTLNVLSRIHPDNDTLQLKIND
ncbi:MAG: serine/threonine protein kinase [bacterium]